jgi:hypothetical protein
MSSEKFTIPKDNDKLDEDIKNRKKEYMNHIFEIFVKSISEKKVLSQVNIFKFEDTNLEVIIKKAQYESNLKNLLEYMIEIEDYEKCSIINNLLKIVEIDSKD